MKEFKSGRYEQQSYYKSFQPNFIHHPWKMDNMEIIQMLSKADRQLGRLDMYSEYVNIDLFIQMHLVKEATQSSKIEGTQTKIEEAFLTAEEIHLDKRDDWEEVQNYILAMKSAVVALENLPFSSRLIRHTHKILLQGVRGMHKLPGEFRTSQNWIGGASINDAVFVPPIHSSIPELISDLEKFANDRSNLLPDIIKAAIIHYQFETIHPFLDGNGRTGRLLITLYLVSTGILKQPILYLSDFFERHRTLYYDNLMRVRTHHDIEQWIKFFLTGVIETAQKGIKTFDGILQLQKNIEIKLNDMGARSGDGLKLIDHLYQNPIIDAKKVGLIVGRSLRTAYNLLNEFEKMGILKEITGDDRNRSYAFQEYIDLFKNK